MRSKEITDLFPTYQMNILFDNGGIGDYIATMPAIRYMKDKFPYITPYLWVPDYYYEFGRNLLPDVIIRPFKKNREYDQTLSARKLSVIPYTNLRSHLTDHAFNIIVNELPDIEHRNYCKLNLDRISINKFNLPEKFVVVTTGFTAPIREMLPRYVNDITKYIIEKGYTPVFLGKRQSSMGHQKRILKGNFREEIAYSKGLDLIDKTDLLQAGKIISQAKCVVGLDNGLLHVAGCTDTPIVGGFTSVDPIHRMAYRNNEKGYNYYPVVPHDSQPEKFFQSRYDFLFEHHYSQSYFGNNDLITSLKAELYIEQLEKIL